MGRIRRPAAGATSARQTTPGLTTPGSPTPIAATSPAKVNFEEQIERRAQQIAERLLRERLDALRRADTGKVFTRFDELNDVVANQKELVTQGLWSSGIGTLQSFYTSSEQTATQKTYYYEVWDSASNADLAEPQFSVAWGHRLGSGSLGDGTTNDSPSRAIYSQYRLLLLEPNDTTFTFANSTDSDNCYFINFQRARLKEKLDPGNWQLDIQGLQGEFFANNEHTGSNVVVRTNPIWIKHLIDDSGDAQQTLSQVGQAGRIHNIVSGSIEGGIYKDGSGDPVYYGLSYPDQGILVLNGDVLDVANSLGGLGFNSVTGSDIAGDNAYKLYAAISGSQACLPDCGFTARNAETVTSTHYFVRVKNAEYNFSNNPTFVTGGLGEFAQPTFVGDPKVYVTTVGMYNDRQELLAVAKLSKPILKSFTNELVVRVKLEF